MTSNQIAAQNVRVSESVAEETKRHNLATEELNNKLSDIEQFKAETDREYKTRSNEIQENYNRWYISYMNSTGREKDEAKTQLDIANAELSEVRKYYETVLGEADAELRQTQSNLNRVDAEYKQFMKGIQSNELYLKAMDTYYKAYNVENSIRLGFAQLNLDNYIKSAQLGLEAKKINNNFTLQMGNLNLEAQKYSLSREQFNYYKEQNKRLVESQLKSEANERFNRTFNTFTPDFGIRINPLDVLKMIP